MRVFRIFSLALLFLVPSFAAAEGPPAGLTAPVERVVARDMRPGLDLADFRILHWAALRDQPETVERLLDRGYDVDDRDVNGRTPLMVAAAFDSPKAAAVLLDRGADTMARDLANGDTALHFAAMAGHAEIAAMLIARGAEVDARSRHKGETPLHYAALYGQRKAIALLAEKGAHIEATDHHGVRPLQYARLRNRILAIELMLSLGAREDDLFDAVNAGDVARVQFLLARGADVNQHGLSGTPLHLAVSTGHVGIAVMLIDAGADLEAKGDPADARPLHVAAYANQPEAARLLVERGADVDARDALERTALSVASAYGYVELATYLLDQRADPNVAALDACGRPLHYAAKASHAEIVKLLLAHGAAVNERGLGGTTALHCAVCYSNLAVVELLVGRGADSSLPDARGKTPMDYAVGSPQLIAVLLNKPRK